MIQDLIDKLTAALAAAQAIADAGSGDAATIQKQFSDYQVLVQAYADAPNDNDTTQLQAMKDFISGLPTPTPAASVRSRR